MTQLAAIPAGPAMPHAAVVKASAAAPPPGTDATAFAELLDQSMPATAKQPPSDTDKKPATAKSTTDDASTDNVVISVLTGVQASPAPAADLPATAAIADPANVESTPAQALDKPAGRRAMPAARRETGADTRIPVGAGDTGSTALPVAADSKDVPLPPAGASAAKGPASPAVADEHTRPPPPAGTETPAHGAHRSETAPMSVAPIIAPAETETRRTSPATEAIAPANAPNGTLLAPGGSAAPAEVATTSLVPTHATDPAWSQDFGQHVIRLAVSGQPSAEIHLNPPDWGPIRVSIDLKGNQATLQFSAEHAQTREVLEISMPRLREIFDAGHIVLLDASVAGQSSFQQPGGSEQKAFQHFATQNTPRAALSSANPNPATPGASSAPHRAGVDLFA